MIELLLARVQELNNGILNALALIINSRARERDRGEGDPSVSPMSQTVTLKPREQTDSGESSI